MPAAYTTMTLSDGVTTADLVDGVNYQLLTRSHAPAVAGRRKLNMAGRGPYVKVVESITLWVRGTDGATCLANLAQLAQLLDQAERFTAGDDVAPVLYKIQPQGSILTAASQSMVFGHASDSSPGINLPMTYNDHLFLFEIGPVRIEFERSGLLIGPAESAVTAATVAANPTIREATLISSHAIPSPIRLEIIGWDDNGYLNIESPSMLFVTAEAEDLYIIEAEGMTATGFTSVADSANDASGGSILRYTATTTDEKFSGSHTVVAASFNLNTEEIAVYAMIKGHATKDFLLWAESASYVFNSAQRTSNPVVVSAGDYTNATPVHLGNLIQRQGHHYIRLVAQALDSTGSPTLNIDYLVLVAMKSTTYQYKLGEMFLSSPFIFSSPSNVSILVDPRPLTSRAPFVGYIEDSADNEAEVTSQGDGALYMPGQTIASLWMGARGANWVDVDAAGNPSTIGMRVIRSKAYLAPQ